MKKLMNNFLMPKLLLALFVMSGMAVFAAQHETVSRALGINRPLVRVEISGNVERAGETIVLNEAETVSAGEVINWTISSVNESDSSAAQNYRVVGQIAKNTIYVEGSAQGEDSPAVNFSIDGGKNFSAQPLVEEKQADGSVKLVPAPVSRYTQVRFEWANPLLEKAQHNASYRVRVK